MKNGKKPLTKCRIQHKMFLLKSSKMQHDKCLCGMKYWGILSGESISCHLPWVG